MKNLFALFLCLAIFSLFSCVKEDLVLDEDKVGLDESQVDNQERVGEISTALAGLASESNSPIPSGSTIAVIPVIINTPSGNQAPQGVTYTYIPPPDVQTLEYDPHGILIFDNP